MLSKWHLLPLALMGFGDSYLLIQEYQWISLKVLRVREMEIGDSRVMYWWWLISWFDGCVLNGWMFDWLMLGQQAVLPSFTSCMNLNLNLITVTKSF